MPIIDINLKDLEKLVGKKISEDDFQYVGGEIDAREGDNIQLEIKCRSRPDLWCVEGIARELKGALGIETGLKKYPIKKSSYKVTVNKKLEKIRPFIACAVVKNVKLSEDIIKQIMQQQDKIDGTYGRKRSKTSIGLYNADLIEFPLKYTITKPTENSFIPLDMTTKLTPKQILSKHPKGREYSHLVDGLKEYPIYLDKNNKVLSMPPIINSNNLGKIKGTNKNILIEVTGTDYETVQNVLKIMTLSLADRNGDIYSVEINYSYRKNDLTPSFKTKVINLSPEKINRLLGLNLSSREIEKLLKKARYNVKRNKVEIPPYRTDILNEVDIIEDIAIMYGYNNFKPEEIKIATKGKLKEMTDFSDKLREIMIGFGLQEVMTFTLISNDILTKKMNLKEKPIKIENPINSNYNSMRNSLVASLLNFLSKNTTKKFPQKIFEVGQVFEKSESTNLAYCSSHNKADFTEAKQVLDALLRTIGLEFEIKETENNSFTEGRIGKIVVNKKEIGIIGEISDKVKDNFGLEKETVCFEINLNKIKN